MATKRDGPTQVRFIRSIKGMAYNLPSVERGDVVTVPSQSEAERLFDAGHAQPVSADWEAPSKPEELWGNKEDWSDEYDTRRWTPQLRK